MISIMLQQLFVFGRLEHTEIDRRYSARSLNDILDIRKPSPVLFVFGDRVFKIECLSSRA